MKNMFTEHPHSINESYFQHLKFALIFGLKMIIGGIACVLHAIFPFIFEKTGSNILMEMAQDFVERMPTADERTIKIAETITKKTRSNP